MTLKQIIQSIRVLLKDEDGSLWTDTEITEAVNEAQRAIIAETPDLLLTSTGCAVAVFTPADVTKPETELFLSDAWRGPLVHYACGWLHLLKAGSTENQTRAGLHLQLKERLAGRR